jgi:hypothetical protein
MRGVDKSSLLFTLENLASFPICYAQFFDKDYDDHKTLWQIKTKPLIALQLVASSIVLPFIVVITSGEAAFRAVTGNRAKALDSMNSGWTLLQANGQAIITILSEAIKALWQKIFGQSNNNEQQAQQPNVAPAVPPEQRELNLRLKLDAHAKALPEEQAESGHASPPGGHIHSTTPLHSTTLHLIFRLFNSEDREKNERQK